MTLTATRQELHRVAAHVLARRRQAVTGRIGLRATPGGVGTPAFGDGPEVVRVDGDHLVRETVGGTAVAALEGASLRQLAAFVDADVDAPIDLGADTPPVGDPDAPISVRRADLAVLARWYDLAWRAIGVVLADVPDGTPSVIQIWPEHFDAAADLAVAPERRVNLGASPGDGFDPSPYLYVGPGGPERPGGGDFWNAPFGATRGATDARGAVAFYREGIRRLRT